MRKDPTVEVKDAFVWHLNELHILQLVRGSESASSRSTIVCWHFEPRPVFLFSPHWPRVIFSLIAFPSLSEILQACHWGISVIKCQRPQQLAESRTPTSSHICQSDTLISPPALFHFPSSLARLFYLFSHVGSTLYSPVSDLFTLVQKAARLWLCVPMLPLHVSHCPEVVLLFRVPVGSVHCNSAVSCKQTSLIGHCYS